MTDRLQRAKARPAFVATAVRTALRDAVAWRIGGGSAPSAGAFTAAASAAARLRLDAVVSDSAERSATLAAVQQAAHRFTRTTLYRRLMTLPAARFVRLDAAAKAPDAAVRDRRRRLHAIVLSAGGDAMEDSALATRIAGATSLPVGDRFAPLNVHVFSLATLRRRTFERDVAGPPGSRDRARVA